MFNLDPATLISRVIVLIIAFTVHEFAHAWIANAFGDDTPRLHGRLTLNPLAHLDLMGSLMLVIAGFGWAKPVPVNPFALSRRSTSANLLVALAGPLSNLVLAVAAAIPVRAGLVQFSSRSGSFLPDMNTLILEFIIINLALMLFNLIPIAPLDGEKVLSEVLPPSMSRIMDTIRPYGPIILLALIVLGRLGGLNLLGFIMDKPLSSLFFLLIGG